FIFNVPVELSGSPELGEHWRILRQSHTHTTDKSTAPPPTVPIILPIVCILLCRRAHWCSPVQAAGDPQSRVTGSPQSRFA
ncbi:hypothetical protein L9F63_000421, partial [Diploptera punctata]